jgi:CheY-like chemotaxis protein
VLVVDDEESVRAVTTRMLTRAGFTVLTAGDGRAALEVFREHADSIRCVLLDLAMPKMDGPETFRHLVRVRDDVPVILSSGYTEEEVTKRFSGIGLAGFIQKPYVSAQLVAVLRGVLDTGRPAP